MCVCVYNILYDICVCVRVCGGVCGRGSLEVLHEVLSVNKWRNPLNHHRTIGLGGGDKERENDQLTHSYII